MQDFIETEGNARTVALNEEFRSPSWLARFRSEVRENFQLAFPTMVRCYLTCAADRCTLGFVGHYDSSEIHIASAAFGKMYSNVTGVSMGVGFALGINTFASQNHGRDADNENGVVLQKCLRSMAPALVFSFVVSLAAQPLLRVLGQPADLLEPSQKFATVQALGLPAFFLKESLNNILVSQGIVTPGMWCEIVSSISNLIFAYILLRTGSGFMGSAWSWMLSIWINVILMVIYVLRAKIQNVVWQIPQQVSALGQISLGTYMYATIPSAFSLWSEWWAAEVLALLAGLIPGAGRAARVGAQGILLNTVAIFYMTFVGVQSAATTRVGNLVGSRDNKNLPIAVLSGVFLALFFSSLLSLLMLALGPSILRLWTTAPDIIAEAEGANAGMVLCFIPYSVMMCLLGVLRGANLQNRGAVCVFVSFWVFGLPVGAYLGISTTLGLMGIWWGNILGLSLTALSLSVLVWHIRWDIVIDMAHQGGEGDQDMQEGS